MIIMMIMMMPLTMMIMIIMINLIFYIAQLDTNGILNAVTVRYTTTLTVTSAL